MSEINFTCVNCGAGVVADESVAGALAQCPNCDATVMIPKQGIKAGMRIAGYEVLRRLGAGGMGEVWLASQTAMERKVALKILSPALTTNRDFVIRFTKEVKTAAKLEHPNIVTSFDAGVDGDIYYLAMSYIDGVHLDDRLAIDGKIPEKEALHIARCIADALCYAWNEFRILHRDIKPSNIMLDARKTPKLMDMGISKSMAEDKKLTMTGMVVGTPHYMSPEQARADSDIDCRSDIYSLGATLYHMVTGEVPYDATTAMGIITKHITDPFPPPQDRNRNVSDECSALLETMMAKRPEDRPSSWEAVIREIDLILAGKFPEARRTETGRAPVVRQASESGVRQNGPDKTARGKILNANMASTVQIPPQEKPVPRKIPIMPVIAGVLGFAVILLLVTAVLMLAGKGGKSRVKTYPPAGSVTKNSSAPQPENKTVPTLARPEKGTVKTAAPAVNVQERQSAQNSGIPAERVILQDILDDIGSSEISTHVRILEKVGKFKVLPAEPTSADFDSFRKEWKTTVLFIPSGGRPFFHNQLPTGGEVRVPDLKMSLARDQKSFGVLGIVPSEDLGGLKLAIGEVKSSSGRVFPAGNIRAYFVKHLMKSTDQFVFRPFPMGLQPLETTVGLRKDITANFMIEAAVPSNTAADTYSGKITVTSGKVTLEKNLVLTVLDFTLMRPPPERMNWGFYCFLKEMKPSDYEFMSGFGMNTVAISADVGSDYADRIRLIRKAGVGGILLLDVGQLEKGLAEKPYSKEWEAKYREKVSLFDRQMREMGENGKYIGMIHDEPRETMLNPWNRTYAQTMIYHRLVGEAAPGIPRGINTMTDGPVSKEHPDGLYAEFAKTFDMVMPHYWAQSRNVIRLVKANPKCSLWSYNDGDNRLAWGLHSWKAGVRGRTLYNYRGYVPAEHPLSPVFMSSREFEGRSFTGNYVISWKDKVWGTAALVGLAEGINDYRYVYTLEKAVERASPERKSAAAEAKSYLESLKKEIPEYAHSDKFTDGSETGSGESNAEIVKNLDPIRAKLAKLIEDLSK